jgi:hypothetical protein
MSEQINLALAVAGDPYYTEHICQRYLIELGWSRRRRKKWLRRQGMKFTRQPDPMDQPGLCIHQGSNECWCGEKDPYFAPVRNDGCGGLGSIACFCGGDFCVCHNHGEVECFGCADCEDEFKDFDKDY